MRKTAKERLAERDARARSELLDALFEPWIGAANNPDLLARLGGLDAHSPKAVTRALTADILPVFETMTRETQGRIRTALTVLMQGDGEEFRTYWLELPPPFGPEAEDADAILPVLAELLAVRRPA